MQAHPDLVRRWVLGMGRGLKRAGGHFEIPRIGSPRASQAIAGLIAQASSVARDPQATESDRAQAIELLACGPFEPSRELLTALLDPAQPRAVQLAAIGALAGYDLRDPASILIARLPQLTPEVRAAAVGALLLRESWTLALFREIRSGRIALPAIDVERRPLLLGHKNPEIAALASELLGGQPSTLRAQVVAEYETALKRVANATRGAEIFQRHCMACHRIGDRGHVVGPDLTASQYRDAADMLTHILDPNRSVPANYVQYAVADRSGRVTTGIITAETATSLTLTRGEGIQETILRSEIDELINTGMSLMPEGFEREISKAEMADLLAYLVSSRRDRPQGSTGLDIGTLPGLIEPDD